MATRNPPRGYHRLGYLGLAVLVIVTALVLINTVLHSHSSSQAVTLPVATATPTTTTPVVTELPAAPINTKSGTAGLPAGAVVQQSGAGTWHVVPGSGPIVGKGSHVYRYQVAVENGIDPAAYDGDEAFAADVAATLGDPRSWIGSGEIVLQRVSASYPHPDFVISLTTPDTSHTLCGITIPYESSCWQPSVNRVVINLARWVRGALAFDGDLGLYRQYAINHEVGHALGNHHVGCAANGALAPVMMQQTFDVADDYVFDVNQSDPTNRLAVPHDGKVCRPNAWPYPLGPTA
ncbi:MAG TPA: DUF3152 domain-containing protein [Pseudonocardiaceae bacterium]|nr:DUF3152 domain-containing protein [Pseudonocardiaceae bacterium]